MVNTEARKAQEQYVSEIITDDMTSWNEEAHIYNNPTFDNVWEYFAYRFDNECGDWIRKNNHISYVSLKEMSNWLAGLAFGFDYMYDRIDELRLLWGYKTPYSRWINGWWLGIANTCCRLCKKSIKRDPLYKQI